MCVSTRIVCIYFVCKHWCIYACVYVSTSYASMCVYMHLCMYLSMYLCMPLCMYLFKGAKHKELGARRKNVLFGMRLGFVLVSTVGYCGAYK